MYSYRTLIFILFIRMNNAYVYILTTNMLQAKLFYLPQKRPNPIPFAFTNEIIVKTDKLLFILMT